MWPILKLVSLYSWCHKLNIKTIIDSLVLIWKNVENTVCEKKSQKTYCDPCKNVNTHVYVHTCIWKAAPWSAVTLRLAVAFRAVANLVHAGLGFMVYASQIWIYYTAWVFVDICKWFMI